MKKGKRKYLIGGILILFLILCFAINPTKKDYLQFSEERTGVLTPTIVEIDRNNFVIFSTYTPVFAHEEGITYLGVLGNFIKVSNGQFE